LADCSELANYPDDQLVTRSQAGEQVAFAELVRRHQPTCAKLALSILRDRADAEDEVQNALWKAYENIEQFQQQSKFSTWLTRIVVNQCLMRLRQCRRARFIFLDAAPQLDAGAFELPDTAQPNPEVLAAQQQMDKVLGQEVRRIPPLLRNVSLLRDMQELPMREVATPLGISVAAAKSRLLRARQQLRNRLDKHQRTASAATLFA
jgi:RNA polymerase sigma-70 factor (ECF subfamily)